MRDDAAGGGLGTTRTPDRTESPPPRRCHVIDTSVLLADPRALERFDEHEVVLPLVVLMELEAKRNHAELGWAARQALRRLEELRLRHGSLTEPVAVNAAGGTARVEVNHVDLGGLPAAMSGDNKRPPHPRRRPQPRR